eukprot:GHUV01053527.1.p1 GENE.GHUV01053527.1~~GHUV01053527.1.p1  ORF type:complete len:134 (+),score=47.44 GHUV01053527.1:2001-2402(+)
MRALCPLCRLLQLTRPVLYSCRCCLCALKHNNHRNAAEILSALRSNHDLAKDYWRLKDALTLLDETPSATLLGCHLPASRSNHSGVKSPRSRAAQAKELLLEQVCEDAAREVAAAAVSVADAVEDEVLRRKIR